MHDPLTWLDPGPASRTEACGISPHNVLCGRVRGRKEHDLADRLDSTSTLIARRKLLIIASTTGAAVALDQLVPSSWSTPPNSSPTATQRSDVPEPATQMSVAAPLPASDVTVVTTNATVTPTTVTPVDTSLTFFATTHTLTSTTQTLLHARP